MELRHAVAALTLIAGLMPLQAHCKAKPKDRATLRQQYIARLESTYSPTAESSTTGSLWTDQSPLIDVASDYKATRLNDTITVVVSVQTNAAQSGSVDNSRDFATSSALTGIFGKTPAATNPIFSGQSSSSLKGKGATASNTLFQTSLTGQVIRVLGNGNLIVEAQRKISMNNQTEDLVVRGMIRPGDIGPGNTVASTALSDLEIEMKGKGIISDQTRPLNPVTRAILWMFNF
jgi:flagellar L-ring protein precursor FlgH